MQNLITLVRLVRLSIKHNQIRSDKNESVYTMTEHVDNGVLRLLTYLFPTDLSLPYNVCLSYNVH